VLVTYGTENNDAAVANGDKNKMTEQDMKQNTKRYANEKKKKQARHRSYAPPLIKPRRKQADVLTRQPNFTLKYPDLGDY